VRVIREISAGCGALVAALGATFARMTGEGTVSRRQVSGKCATFCAVDAGVHRVGVVLVTISHERRTMLKAAIALLLTVSAGLRAGGEGRIVLMGFVGRDGLGTPRTDQRSE
jgi:hypothetical protein